MGGGIKNVAMLGNPTILEVKLCKNLFIKEETILFRVSGAAQYRCTSTG